jgi:diguanylate cyclase (GGDEF)-like protein
LDNFKGVNNRLGHQAGDRILQKITTHILVTLRSSDVLARLGGDESAILFPQTSYLAVKGALARLHDQLRELSHSEGWPVGYSLGAISFQELSDSLSEMIHQTDLLMYEVKKNG